MLLAGRRPSLAQAAFAAAVALLAAGPAHWLAETWRDPAFASSGFAYFAIAAALFAWSVTSPVVREADAAAQRQAILLLAATACVRLAGQVLAVDTIGAFALAIDVFALARLAGLERRARAISPFWLAVMFAFSLPLERIAQRLIGFGLQQLSAEGACGVLSVLFGAVQCAGVRITVDGADVLVDLPCSGSRALLMFGFAFAALAALARPSLRMAVIGAILALTAAFAGNVLRIVLLASGVALGPDTLGFDVMAQPWHDIAGLVSLGAALPVLLSWSRNVKPRRDQVRDAPSASPRVAHAFSRLGPAASFAFLAAALAIVAAPRAPVDIARRDLSVEAPMRLGDYAATPIALTRGERDYFQQYGGAAAKAAYGPFALLVTRTSAPLRHLHAPDECLRGLGYRVSYVGLRFEPTPTAIYRAVAPDGRAYRVETSFVSDSGQATASVAEAIWLWLADRTSTWGAVQRIAPETADPNAFAAFDRDVIAALDLPTTARFASQGGSHAR